MHDISESLAETIKKGFKVYPIANSSGSFAVEVCDRDRRVYKNEITRGEHKHNKSEINIAIVKTILYIADKINNSTF